MPKIPSLVNIDEFEIGNLAIGISMNIEEPDDPLMNIEIIQGDGEYVSLGLILSPKKLRIMAKRLMEASFVSERK